MEQTQKHIDQSLMSSRAIKNCDFEYGASVRQVSLHRPDYRLKNVDFEKFCDYLTHTIRKIPEMAEISKRKINRSASTTVYRNALSLMRQSGRTGLHKFPISSLSMYNTAVH